jgi:hypothetical protein
MKIQWNKIQIRVTGKQFDKENPTEFYAHCAVYKICKKKHLFRGILLPNQLLETACGKFLFFSKGMFREVDVFNKNKHS